MMRALVLALCALGCCAAPVRRSANATIVHLVLSNHLDIGFNSQLPDVPGTDDVVINRYFKEYFPAAIATAAELRRRGGPERLRYLTQSFLVSLYVDCPRHVGIYCPGPAELAAFDAAVRAGDITWHALPHNAQLEVMDADLLEFAVQLTHALDRRFDLPPKVTASQRDVPGLTRSAVAVLAGAGVKALSVGVNSASAPPDVPHNTPFVWLDERSGQSLLAMWHPNGYSGWPVDSAAECVQTAGFDRVLCAAWKGDNDGPHTADEVVAIYRQVAQQFPGAELVASSFDDFVLPLAAAAPALALPVVTGEIGDTWVYGVASDPGKVAEFRALMRMRRASRDRWDDAAFAAFSRLLLKIPEHTWGLDSKSYPGDFQRWRNVQLREALAAREPKFLAAVGAWQRQRAWNRWAVDELGNSSAGAAARGVLLELQRLKAPPTPHADPSFRGCIPRAPLSFNSSSWHVELDSITGAIVRLEFWGASHRRSRTGADRLQFGARKRDGAPRRSWAAPDSPLAEIVYSTYDEASFSPIWEDYSYQSPLSFWAYHDFGKPGATELGGATRLDARPRLQRVWHRGGGGGGGLHLVTRATFEPELVAEAGAPATIYTEIRSLPGSNDLLVDVVWENKTATRLPEALWVRWRPDVRAAADPASWTLSKLGRPVSPAEVLRNGSWSMHAVDDSGASVTAADGSGDRLHIRSLDAALISPGEPTPFPNVRRALDMRQGVSFCLVNNIWGTNYVMWYPYDAVGDGNMRFRFVLQAEESGVAPTAAAAAA